MYKATLLSHYLTSLFLIYLVVLETNIFYYCIILSDFAPERIPSTIILQPEETIKCFVSDAIIDDEIALEPMEFFTLTIDDVTPNDVTRINLGPPAMIVINDNDGKLMM